MLHTGHDSQRASDNISLKSNIGNDSRPTITAIQQRCLKWNGVGESGNISGACFSGEMFCFLMDSSSNSIDESSDGKSAILREIIGVCKHKPKKNSLHNIYINYVGASGGSNYAHVQQLNDGYENSALLDIHAEEFMFETLSIDETLSFYNAMTPDPTSAENIAIMTDIVSLMELNSYKLIKVGYLRPPQRRLLLIATELLLGRDCIIYENFTVGLNAVDTAHVLRVLRTVLVSFNPNCFIMLTAPQLSFVELQYFDRMQVVSTVGESSYYGVTTPVKDYCTSEKQAISFAVGDLGVLDPMFFSSEHWLSYYSTCAIESAVSPVPGASNHISSDLPLFGATAATGGPYDETPQKLDLNVQTVGYTEMDNATRTPMHDHLLASGGVGNGAAPAVKSFSNATGGRVLIKARLSSGYNGAVDKSIVGYIQRLGRQFGWCMWRSFIVHWRNVDSAAFVWLIGGVTSSLGVMATFFDLSYTLEGFQNRCALITTYPFGVCALTNILYGHTLQSRNVLAWDRNRDVYLPVFALFTDFLGELLIFKTIPPFLACCIPYYGLNFNQTWGAFWTFLETIMYIGLVAAAFARLSFTLLAPSMRLEPGKAAIQTVGVYAIMILYAGFIVNIPTLPHWIWFLRDFSMFYWGCNILYYNDMGTA